MKSELTPQSYSIEATLPDQETVERFFESLGVNNLVMGSTFFGGKKENWWSVGTGEFIDLLVFYSDTSIPTLTYEHLRHEPRFELTDIGLVEQTYGTSINRHHPVYETNGQRLQLEAMKYSNGQFELIFYPAPQFSPQEID
jgi:hypothetical protein